MSDKKIVSSEEVLGQSMIHGKGAANEDGQFVLIRINDEETE